MNKFCLHVWGDFACFTRPEMKVERVSYDAITPSAARAIFEAILWKPAICWHVYEIRILKPISWINVRRNELAGIASKGKKCIYIEDDRQQRAGLLLKNVEYLLFAFFDMTKKAGDNDNPIKFSEMFKRRAASGQCAYQPYLGCREFSAEFELIGENDLDKFTSISENRDLGWMLYDIDYDKQDLPAAFFRAQMHAGVVKIPDWNSDEVKR